MLVSPNRTADCKGRGEQKGANVKSRRMRASRQSELDVLATELQGLAEGHQSRSSARKKLEDERKLIMEEIQHITATEQQIERERRLTQVCQDLAQVIPGVSGRVVNLCQPVQKKYRVAVNVALGNYMDAVVTDSIQHARQCVQHLKERMMEPLTFLPMDNLRAAPEDRLKEALRGHKSLRPALSCISHEPHLNRAFQFMLSDVVVADSLEDGRRFVFEHLKDAGIKCRVVTLNGETISRDGNLAVSSEARQGSTRFDFSELETTKRRLEAIDNELMGMRSQHCRENAAYAAVEDAKKQAELVARDAEREFQRAEAELQSRQKELSAAEQQLSEVATDDPQEEERLQTELKNLEQRIGVATANLFGALDAQLGADVRSMERELRRKREALQFQEDAVLRQQAALKAELAMLELTLEECRSRSRGSMEDEATVQALQQRHQELDQQLAALKERVNSDAEALQKQGELLKSQEQAVAAARRDLKEKQREAAEGERRLSMLGSELKEAREARLQLLCQSLLEDVDLPFLGSKKDCKAALRRVVSAGSESSGHELSIDVQLDYQQLPEERRAAAGSGPASKLLEDEYRNELRRLGGQLEQVQPNLKAIDQLEEADQEAMAAEREVQKAKKKMEVVERSFEQVRCQRREKFMQCFHQVQEEIQEVYRSLSQERDPGPSGQFSERGSRTTMAEKSLDAWLNWSGFVAEELQAENEKLKEKLREKVWTMALASVSEMEKISGGIAALERAVFGQSASSDDLERIVSLEADYKQLQDDYMVLSDEYEKLQNRPPVVIEKEDKRADFLEELGERGNGEQLGRMQEQYQAMQMKLNKMRVEHLELQSAHKELTEKFDQVKIEAEKVEKQLTNQLRALREKHARMGQELQELRSAHHEAKKQLEHLREASEQSQHMEQLRSDYESLLGSFHRLQEDHEQLVEKSNRFRNTLSDAWNDSNQVNTSPKAGALLPPLTPNSRCPTPQTPTADKLTKGAAVGFEGGSAFLDLEDLEDPWNGGIKFTAMPPSKRFCDMALLSGGEKTVAAMSLLFAIQAYQRPPFLVLDEIDAHLDHSNVLALAKFIDSIGCQAIVISQKDRFFTHGEGLVGISKHRDTSVVFTMDLTRMRPARAVGKLDESHVPMEAVPLQ
eukprot:s3311_g2.t2